MVHSKRGSLRRVALSGALLAGVSTIGLFSWPTLASATTTKTQTTKYTLTCKTGIANGDVTVTTTQTYPVSVAAGAKFTIAWKSTTEVGGTLASAAYAIAPKGSEKGIIHVDDDKSTDATPATLNVAGTKGLSEVGTISSPSGFPVYTPPLVKGKQGTFTTPDFTAGKKGTDKISATIDDADVTIYNSSGGKVTTTTADCSPVGTPAVIATITVS
jgi:hypothetical protein